mmetsp:Transcript_9139/g.22914  ORF Transcript_9139/g.22914 Transcript_9139/m.22914 type:complete len:494 (-) Transcript_9139:1104-2585(-)|eukprot:CAMPEP_0177640790 /NCGR_PEP_ID=MMETSP0447-20121125/6726_1 /TAXON_ID=0 /ORGANISM="Stygamoeba regulata, Strain BSH-02190019" /LENGTH=493 /DNA_ID=CAMNT_0019142875 /DNA_START=124 /DNA_END=1605 /DNA_ORIENTATION=+
MSSRDGFPTDEHEDESWRHRATAPRSLLAASVHEDEEPTTFGEGQEVDGYAPEEIQRSGETLELEERLRAFGVLHPGEELLWSETLSRRRRLRHFGASLFWYHFSLVGTIAIPLVCVPLIVVFGLSWLLFVMLAFVGPFFVGWLFWERDATFGLHCYALTDLRAVRVYLRPHFYCKGMQVTVESALLREVTEVEIEEDEDGQVDFLMGESRFKWYDVQCIDSLHAALRPVILNPQAKHGIQCAPPTPWDGSIQPLKDLPPALAIFLDRQHLPTVPSSEETMSLLSSVDMPPLRNATAEVDQEEDYDAAEEKMVYLSHPSRFRSLLSSRFFAPTRSPRAASRTCFQLVAGASVLVFWFFFMIGLGILASDKPSPDDTLSTFFVIFFSVYGSCLALVLLPFLFAMLFSVSLYQRISIVTNRRVVTIDNFHSAFRLRSFEKIYPNRLSYSTVTLRGHILPMQVNRPAFELVDDVPRLSAALCQLAHSMPPNEVDFV